MRYKLGNHIHTKESSECSKISAKEIVKTYKEKGYNTIIITDHCYEKYFSNKRLESWDNIIEYLCVGYEQAKVEAELIGLNVLFGIELTLKETDSDYLIYGVTKDALLDTPYLYNYTLKKLKEWCIKNGYLLIQAHPYRESSIKIARKEEVDGFEITNGSDADEKNIKAYNYAKQEKMIMISGDDTHYIKEIGKTNIITRKEIKDMDSFISHICNQNYSLSLDELENRFSIEFEHKKEDFIDVWDIENEYLKDNTISSIEQVIEWDNKNSDIHIFVRDKLRDIIVGEITILPLNDEQFNKFIKAELDDTQISSKELEQYEDNKEYYLLFSTVAIKKEYRNNPIILYLLLLGFSKKIKYLKSRGINFKNICSEGQTIEGRNFSKSFLQARNITTEGYIIYLFSNINDKALLEEAWVKLDKYIEKYYNYKVKELI